MKGFKVAGRYAQSLLELAQERKSVDAVLKDMTTFINVSNENRDFTAFLNNPIIKSDKKNSVLDKLFPSFEELTMKFAYLLTKNRREMLLPLIAEEFIAKVKEARGIVPVTLTSARKLDDTVKQSILDKLNKGVKGEIELNEKVDDALIGGFVVRMGDTRIDASVAHQLSELKQRLTR
jgi:F-type H+-transporting ATPase subunit delta